MFEKINFSCKEFDRLRDQITSLLALVEKGKNPNKRELRKPEREKRERICDEVLNEPVIRFLVNIRDGKTLDEGDIISAVTAVNSIEFFVRLYETAKLGIVESLRASLKTTIGFLTAMRDPEAAETLERQLKLASQQK